MKQCVTSFARCMLWRYVQPYLTKQCAHPDIYITVWGSIDTHRYIYIIYNNNIYFYALIWGHRYKYIIFPCAYARAWSIQQCNLVDSGLTQKQCPGLCVFVCVVSVTHANGTGEGSPFQGYAPGWAAPPLIFYFFYFSVVLVLCLSMLFAIIIAQPRFYGLFMPYFRFKSFLR